MILKFHRRRILLFFCLVLAVKCVLLAKMYSVQVLHRDKWRSLLERSQVRTNKVWRKRGTVFDSSGTPLAFSYTTWSLVADPFLISNPETAATSIANILGWDTSARNVLEVRLSDKTRRFEYIQRKLEPNVATRIRALKLKGLDFLPEHKRFYTNPKLASNVIGLVGMDDRGLAGIEYSYDDQLSGLAGEIIHFSGLKDIEIPKANLVVNQPKGGHHIYLTIDSGIQQIADAASEKLMTDFRPTNCFVLVVDPYTGEVLACSMRPTYDQSSFVEYSKDVSKARNLPIGHIFEPGSTFKVVTMAAALEEDKVKPNTPFHCPGFLSLWGIKIGCTSVHGDLTATDVIEKSCNVGAMSTGVVLGARSLYYYIRKFGFGERTGIELPGEANGILRLPKDWSGLSVGAIAMGQEIGVTGIQMAMAVSSIVNGGKLLKPTIIKRVTTYDNRRVLYRARPTVRHQVVTPETAEKVKTMMFGVVGRGTGRRAGSDLYSAGGKTGTSQKLGRHSRARKESGERDKINEKVVTSFVGFFPYDKPQYLIYVMANEPQAYRAAGGTVAAPLFREIASRIVWYKGMIPDVVCRAPLPVPDEATRPPDADPLPGPGTRPTTGTVPVTDREPRTGVETHPAAAAETTGAAEVQPETEDPAPIPADEPEETPAAANMPALEEPPTTPPTESAPPEAAQTLDVEGPTP
ncbi:MAG: hypothetical protein HY814_03000 [Candidatus Riflebacteria bacterium]|nr:hypothetical protein [Candidatus Riflebacteria bacterium]